MISFSYLIDDSKKENINRYVVGAIIKNNGKFLLLLRPKNNFMGGIYELASGKVEKGENLIDALYREVNEETNLDILEITQYLGSFDYISKNGDITRQFNFMVLVKEPININLQEHDNFVWVSQSEINNYKVTDSVKQILAAL